MTDATTRRGSGAAARALRGSPSKQRLPLSLVRSRLTSVEPGVITKIRGEFVLACARFFPRDFTRDFIHAR
jgi:hypothetical protein